MARTQVTVTLHCIVTPSSGIALTPDDHRFDDHLFTREFVLTPESSLMSVGRSSKRNRQRGEPRSDNALFNSPVISRKHAEFFMEQGSKHLFIKDCGSMHGTTVAGQRLKPGNQTRLNNFDIITIGSSVLYGDREYQARTFTVNYKFETIRAKEPSVIPVEKPTTALTPIQPKAFKLASATFVVPDDSDEEEMHIDEVDVGHIERPGSSLANPLDIDDEEIPRRALSTQQERSKKVKRTYIAITELTNGTNEGKLDVVAASPTAPVLPAQPEDQRNGTTGNATSSCAVVDDEDAEDEESENVRPGVALTMTQITSKLSEEGRRLGISTARTPERQDEDVFTPESSYQSSPATSPPPGSDEMKLGKTEVATNEFDSAEDSDYDDDESSVQLDDARDTSGNTLDYEQIEEEDELDDTQECMPAEAHKKDADIQPQSQRDIAGSNNIPDESSKADSMAFKSTVGDALNASIVIEKQAEGGTARLHQPFKDSSPFAVDSTSKHLASVESLSHTQHADVPPVGPHSWFQGPNPVPSSLFPPTPRDLVGGSYQSTKEWDLLFDYPAYAPRNEYHPMYPVNGLNQTPYSLPEYGSMAFGAIPPFLPKLDNRDTTANPPLICSDSYSFPDRDYYNPQSAKSSPAIVCCICQVPGHGARDCPDRPIIADEDMLVSTKGARDSGKSKISAATKPGLPNPLGANPVHRSAPWVPSARTKLSISNIVDHSPPEQAETVPSTFKRKADLISTSDHSSSHKFITSAVMDKPLLIHDDTKIETNENTVATISLPSAAALTTTTTKVQVSAQERPRKKARTTYAASARPFLLGALLGGVGVFGALLAVPDSLL